MFKTILHVTGLDRKLETLKFEIEGKANQAISHIKAVGLQIAVATVFAVAAVIFTALAILAGFVSLFVWLQPVYGTLPTICMVAGALALIALVFMAIAVVVGKRRPEPINLSTPASKARPSGSDTETDLAFDKAKSAAPPSSSEMLDSGIDLVGLFANYPRTGNEQIDNIIRAVEPRADEATKDAVHRAATLVQTGDRKTMIAILGAAAAMGWLIAKSGSHTAKRIASDGNADKSSWGRFQREARVRERHRHRSRG